MGQGGPQSPGSLSASSWRVMTEWPESRGEWEGGALRVGQPWLHLELSAKEDFLPKF